ncbi:hypothetical protein HUU42_11130 [bacterium]|nr:hypothetical protein [bacterium]
MKILIVSLATLLLFVACSKKKEVEVVKLTAAPALNADSASLAIANQMMEAMGGQKAFNDARYIRFDFVVARRRVPSVRHAHLWDKWTGRYRVEGKMRDGKSYAVLFNDVNKKSGEAYLDSQKVTADSTLQKQLDYGYGRFINDTYWLIMPWKIKDPGVTLKYEGSSKDESGIEHDIVHLSFSDVGLTPKDHYWVYINKTTHLMDRWKFVLNGDSTETGDYLWEEWKDFNSIKLSVLKSAMAADNFIRMENVSVSDAIDESLFTDFSKPLH